MTRDIGKLREMALATLECDARGEFERLTSAEVALARELLAALDVVEAAMEWGDVMSDEANEIAVERLELVCRRWTYGEEPKR